MQIKKIKFKNWDRYRHAYKAERVRRQEDKDLFSSESPLEIQYSHSALSSQPHSFPPDLKKSITHPLEIKPHLLQKPRCFHRVSTWAKPTFPHPTCTLLSPEVHHQPFQGTHRCSQPGCLYRYTIISHHSLPQTQQLFHSIKCSTERCYFCVLLPQLSLLLHLVVLSLFCSRPLKTPFTRHQVEIRQQQPPAQTSPPPHCTPISTVFR